MQAVYGSFAVIFFLYVYRGFGLSIFTLKYFFTLNFFCFMHLSYYIEIKFCVFDSL